MDDIAALIAKNEGKKYYNNFRQQISAFIEKEEGVLSRRQVDSARAFMLMNKSVRTLGDSSEWVEHTYKNNFAGAGNHDGRDQYGNRHARFSFGWHRSIP